MRHLNTALSTLGLLALLAGCSSDTTASRGTTGGSSDTGSEADTSSGGSDAVDDTTVADTGATDSGLEIDISPDTAADTAADTSGLAHFSFFVTSWVALQELSGSPDGFGGDLRYGETGPGAGLRGADKICAEIAERSMPGAGAKEWHAFLSATDDGFGNQVDAIDRIGEGPWYDRLGRVFANAKADLIFDRPSTADAAIRDDFPNEDGVPNHAPDPADGQVDNHDMLTGSNAQGRLYSQTATCADWTGATGTEGKPRVGHSWPRTGTRPGPGGGSVNMANWMSALDESGCAPGANLIEMGPPIATEVTVGSGGGYGGFYCFAMTP